MTRHEEVPRVEGDLKITWEDRHGLISKAWCQGTMYRGYEMILIGRPPEDALATTARLCGICSTSHVVAATHALEDAWDVTPPPQAVRLRNLFLAAESLMSDARQGALFFGPGLCDRSFFEHSLYPDIVHAFEPVFRGWLPRQVREYSKRVLGVITAFTDQWPHSIPFRPGGASCAVGPEQIQRARAAVYDYATWYTQAILGGTLEDWAAVETVDQFHEWICRRRGLIGLYARYAIEIGLHRYGHGSPNLLSGGMYRYPHAPRQTMTFSGVHIDGLPMEFDQAQIQEHARFSWFADHGPQHPTEVVVTPDRSRQESYSWATATRYGAESHVMQVGPLAEMLVDADPLTVALSQVYGTSAFLRQLVRWTRGAATLALMRYWLDELWVNLGEPTREEVKAVDGEAKGFGVTNATRGTLMHWVTLHEGKIATYQVITPTTWNASPRDSWGVPGHFEQSLVGLPAGEDGKGLRALVLGSHDPCLVCTTQ